MTPEERLNELLRDAPTGEELRAMLPSSEELTATINRLIADIAAGR